MEGMPVIQPWAPYRTPKKNSMEEDAWGYVDSLPKGPRYMRDAAGRFVQEQSNDEWREISPERHPKVAEVALKRTYVSVAPCKFQRGRMLLRRVELSPNVGREGRIPPCTPEKARVPQEYSGPPVAQLNLLAASNKPPVAVGATTSYPPTVNNGSMMPGADPRKLAAGAGIGTDRPVEQHLLVTEGEGLSFSGIWKAAKEFWDWL